MGNTQHDEVVEGEASAAGAATSSKADKIAKSHEDKFGIPPKVAAAALCLALPMIALILGAIADSDGAIGQFAGAVFGIIPAIMRMLFLVIEGVYNFLSLLGVFPYFAVGFYTLHRGMADIGYIRDHLWSRIACTAVATLSLMYIASLQFGGHMLSYLDYGTISGWYPGIFAIILAFILVLMIVLSFKAGEKTEQQRMDMVCETAALSASVVFMSIVITIATLPLGSEIHDDDMKSAMEMIEPQDPAYGSAKKELLERIMDDTSGDKESRLFLLDTEKMREVKSGYDGWTNAWTVDGSDSKLLCLIDDGKVQSADLTNSFRLTELTKMLAQRACAIKNIDLIER